MLIASQTGIGLCNCEDEVTIWGQVEQQAESQWRKSCHSWSNRVTKSVEGGKIWNPIEESREKLNNLPILKKIPRF
jgi:hypothetical protein